MYRAKILLFKILIGQYAMRTMINSATWLLLSMCYISSSTLLLSVHQNPFCLHSVEHKSNALYTHCNQPYNTIRRHVPVQRKYLRPMMIHTRGIRRTGKTLYCVIHTNDTLEEARIASPQVLDRGPTAIRHAAGAWTVTKQRQLILISK